MNPSLYQIAFIPAEREFRVEDLKRVIQESLAGMPFSVEINDAADDDAGDDFGNLSALMAEDPEFDFTSMDDDLLLMLDDYPVLIGFTTGDEANELATGYDDAPGLSDREADILLSTQCCLEFFSEEDDPEGKYAPGVDAITAALKREFGAVLVNGQVEG